MSYKNKKNKGVSLIEALVAIIVVGVGFASILQLAAYATRTTDVAIERNKVNFIAEMMAEDIIADKANANNYNKIFECSYPVVTGSQVSDFRTKRLQENFIAVLNVEICKAGDIKNSNVTTVGEDSNATINLHLGDGNRKKYIGVKVK
jgi:type IV pilus modification protein PilV